MKNISIIHILILFLAVLACKCVHAQDFLVTTKGDTLTGEIKSLNYGPEKKVQLKSADKKKTVYSMFQIAYYSLDKEVFYPVKGPYGYSFMKLLKPGYLSLYSFTSQDQLTYDGLYLLKKDGRGTTVPNISFKKILANFLEDCPEVSTKIQNDEFSKKDLEKIIDAYNACIISRTNHLATQQNSISTKDKVGPWNILVEKITALENFSEKENVLEMISEVKKKISSAEKVPNFLISGIKQSVTEPTLQQDLANAINSMDE